MIDHERLREFESDFGADELEQILACFLDEAAEAVEALRTAWPDPCLRRDRLHFLKGCARTVGAARLGDLCESLEGKPCPDGFRRLEDAFRRTADAIARDRRRRAG